LTRATSCPGLLAVLADADTPNSVSSSQHLLAFGSPGTASLLHPSAGLSSPLSIDRISVATQTVSVDVCNIYYHLTNGAQPSRAAGCHITWFLCVKAATAFSAS